MPPEPEVAMTRSDVKKVAWTLRLIGYGLLAGAFALMAMGAQRVSATPGAPAPVSIVK